MSEPMTARELAHLQHTAEKGARMGIPGARDILQCLAEIERLKSIIIGAALQIEIRCVSDACGDGRPGQELWIDGKWCVSMPRWIDGNHVAHNVSLALRDRGISSSYELVGREGWNATA
jgi:hypothetical protein